MFDLSKMAERIKAGKPVDPMSIAKALAGPDINIAGCSWHTITVEQAVKGSLDAALFLHEAALPGWRVLQIRQYSCLKEWEVNLVYGNNPHEAGQAPTPAAAWVAAILRAKSSVCETTQKQESNDG